MKINWCIPSKTQNYNQVLPSIWIRCLQVIPYLEKLGVVSVINEPYSDADLFYFVRWQNADAYELANGAKNRGRKVLFDLVVNYYQESPPVRGAGVTRQQVVECMRMTEISDAVTTCSQFIALCAQTYHDKVFYLPDSINPSHFSARKPLADFERQPLRLIWSGVSSKLRDLDPILPLIQKHGFELIVLSNRYVPLPGISRFYFLPGYRLIKWQYETFPQDILLGDISISYRDLTVPYNLGLSHFKIGVMMAQGLPSIASPVPAYLEVIPSAAPPTGWICSTLDDWDQTFTDMASDHHELQQRSRAAQVFMQRYETPKIVNQYVEMFHSLLN